MRKKKARFNRNYIIGGSALLMLALILLILELTNTTHLFHKQSPPAIIPSHDRNGSKIMNSSNSQNPSDNSSNNTDDNTSLPTDVSDHTLIAPFGNFVSNHFPGENGSPTTESSVCNTSPGATCYIKFTNVDSRETTQLPSKVVDSHGSATWYWDIDNDAHLTSGQWQITATATLGSQVKSTSDNLNLSIK